MPKRVSRGERVTRDALFSGTLPPATANGAPAAVAEPNVKMTAYITPAQDLALEEVRLRRRRQGERVDKSVLLREAIDLFLAQEGA